MNDKDRRVLFLNTAEKKNLHPAIVEKDFWVCYILDYLFHRSQYSRSFVFKGGTSLSMAYHLIERFSEDIDLILDWRTINYESEDIWEKRSNTKQAQYNEKMNQDAATFICGDLLTSLTDGLKKELSFQPEIFIDPDDETKQVLDFAYPRAFHEDYIRPEIRLEIGPIAEWMPSHWVEIQSIAAEQYATVFAQPTTEVLTIDAERTFWEKATILHKIAHFPESKRLPLRYARHYYDLYRMSKSSVKQSAFDSKELLARDIIFKSKFYYSRNASYETATLERINLMPPERLVPEIRADYERMKNMIYGEIPDFTDIMAGIAALENEIHQLAMKQTDN